MNRRQESFAPSAKAMHMPSGRKHCGEQRPGSSTPGWHVSGSRGSWGSQLTFPVELDFRREESKASSHREVALEMVWVKI